jgi:hypothetical protein
MFITLVAVVAVPTLLLLVAFVVVARLATGWEVDLDLGARPVGVQATAEGGVLVRDGPCAGIGRSAVLLRAPDGSVVWRADAAGSQPIDELQLGSPPPGFRDVVSLTRPLEPRAIYTVELYAVTPPANLNGATSASNTPFLVAGGTASFRPADLRTDRVWFGGRLLTADEFRREACPPDRHETRRGSARGRSLPVVGVPPQP